ncbi:Zinc finger, FYVE/PHD-type [Artemisia annua]|uniref:Zinc finger, FYVE/PHD-type n=1 Tax=Artemisia annua TaxID=35608 RepID=A0A2U1Q9A4_ARTAN|nr:Zinc finger, FYVE/PHD-type [Artemisia annua]
MDRITKKLKNPAGDSNWIVLRGKNASEENRALLKKAVDILHDVFKPIIDPVTRNDFIQSMAYGNKAVTAGLFHVFGRNIAELSIVATSKSYHRKCVFHVFGRNIAELSIVATSKSYKGSLLNIDRQKRQWWNFGEHLCLKEHVYKDLGDEYCNEVNESMKLFDSPAVDVDNKVDGLHNVSKGNLEKAEKQEDEEEQREKSSKMSVEVENRRKLIEKLNSPPMRRALEQCGTRKRRDGWRNCVFPWSDLVIDRYFWDCLIGLDHNRKGWLCDEFFIKHAFDCLYLPIDFNTLIYGLATCGHTRPLDMDWSKVSCFFLPLLMKGTIPVWFANKETHPLGWGDVERVFIPINEPEKHWSLAVFHIQAVQVRFYDI